METMQSKNVEMDSRSESLCCIAKAKWDCEEAQGFVLTTGCRGPVFVVSTLFASVAMNSFAESVADCEGRVFDGYLKASNVLATVAVAEGVIGLVLNPLVGAFSDLTKYRRPFILFCFALLMLVHVLQCIVFFPQESERLDPNEDSSLQIFLYEPVFRSEGALIVTMVMAIVSAASYEAMTLLTITYVPEFSSQLNDMAKYVGKAYIFMNSIQVVLAALIVALGILLNLNDFEQIVASSFIGGILALILFIPGFKLLGERSKVPDGLSRSYCGLGHICKSTIDSMSKYSQLRLLFLSWGFTAAGASSVISLATVYLQFVLGFKGTTVSLMLSFALVMAIAGTFLAWKLAYRIGLRTTHILLNVSIAISFILGPMVLKADPIDQIRDSNNVTLIQYGNCDSATLTQDELETLNANNVEASDAVFFLSFIFVGFWGIVLGGTTVTINALFAALIPAGSESAYFGIRVTFAKSMSFIPPLIFSAINEGTEGVNPWSVVSISPFFFIGGILTYFLRIEKGREEVSHTLHLRRGNLQQNQSSAQTLFPEFESKQEDSNPQTASSLVQT